MPSIILETDRLLLQEFTIDDAGFILKLVNDPAWLQYIGDRKVYTIADAERYLLEGSIKSYTQYGFGFWKVVLKNTGEPIGSAGIAKRDYLDDVDIGFAFLPEYNGLGYAFEISEKILQHALGFAGLKRVVAITTKNNHRSMKLLSKLGLELESEVTLDGIRLNLFAIDAHTKDRKEINALVDAFFNLFTNTNGAEVHLEKIFDQCIPEAIIVKNVSSANEVYTLSSFIAPRQKLLTDGSLIDFREKEISGQTDLFGNIAQRFSHYQKSGILNGKAFETKGAKSFQFVRTISGWKISAMVWDDEG